MTNSLVVKITVGAEAPERCSQALSVAAAALAMDVPVSVWLAGEAAWLAVPGRAGQIQVAFSPPLADTLQQLVEQESVTVCSPCARRRDLDPADLIEGVKLGGAATFVAQVTEQDVQALVY